MKAMVGTMSTRGDESDADPFHSMDDGLLIKILSCLPAPQDVAHSFSVCQRWRESGIDGGLWRQLCTRKNASATSILSRIKFAHDLRSDSPQPSSAVNLTAEASVFCQLAWELCSPPKNARSCIERALRASSTDNFPMEAIEKTLQPSPQWPNPNTPSYWSSKGHSDSGKSETLTYELKTPVCVVHEVFVRPFQAFFQIGEPIYSSQAVKFRFGYRVRQDKSGPQKPTRSTGNRILDMLENDVEEEYEWTYESPQFTMQRLDSLQRFVLPQPVLCLGGIFQVELVGRVQTQLFDNLFYICICHVKAIGRTLPQFDFSLEEDGCMRLNLKKPPYGLKHALSGMDRGEVRSRVKNRRSSMDPCQSSQTAVDLQRRVRDLRNRAATDDVALEVLNWLLDNAHGLPPNDILLRMLENISQSRQGRVQENMPDEDGAEDTR